MKLDDDARRLEAWLSKGMHGTMHYMEKHFDLRIDPSKLLPGAPSSGKSYRLTGFLFDNPE